MRTTIAWAFALILAAFPPWLDARKAPHNLNLHAITEDSNLFESDIPQLGRALFGVAQASTTWLGADPSGTAVVVSGVWDFDNRGTIVCSVDPDDPTVYIKNGAFAQGWTSEDVFAQRGTFFHAEDFSDSDLACSRGAVGGDYSAWCGKVAREATECFVDAPGYGHSWNQWLSRVVTLADANNTLAYTFRNDTEEGFDYTYVLIDTMVTTHDCGYIIDYPPYGFSDTLRCYTDNLTSGFDLTEIIDLSDPSDWCDGESAASGFYDGKAVRISFLVVSDGGWDDEDGKYTTCDGAFAVDDIIVTTDAGPDTTDFESGTLEDWTACPGASTGGGDFTAIRDVSVFLNHDPCCFDNTSMSGCVLAQFDPNVPGQYGSGGHYYRDFYNRAWTPAIDLTAIADGSGFVASFDAYLDLPIANWYFYRFHVSYSPKSGCPAGSWSPATSDNYVYYSPYPKCRVRYHDLSSLVPNDADLLKLGLSTWSGCGVWAVPCTEGNESPIFDNVRVGVYYGRVNAPKVSLAGEDNFCDAFPEDGTASPTSTARIDIADNHGGGNFLNLGDTLVVYSAQAQAVIELCLKVIPGPGTDLDDPFFTTWFPGTYVPCDTSAGVNSFHCARLDTAFTAGNGVNPVHQVIKRGRYASVFHEDDPRYSGAEGVEILPDSLFTPGTKIYYYIKSSYVGSGEHATLPAGATEEDLSTLFEIEVLPDLCKDPLACMIYFDYFNRGAQAPIENALRELGRTWDRYDLGAEGSFEANGIGNRFLGSGKYVLRGLIGPSLAQLDQYKVIFINNGTLGSNTAFTDGGGNVISDPTDDVAAMEAYLTEGPSRGLWLSGNDIAYDFKADPISKAAFLSGVLGAQWDHNSYRTYSGHGTEKRCRDLHAGYGDCASDNYFSVTDSVGLYGSGCPTLYEYDVIHKNAAAGGIVGDALLYDRSDVPGQSQGGPAYASVYHIFATGSGTDSARTVLDGFSLHLLKDTRCWTGGGIRDWARDLLGNPGPSGVIAPGFFALRPLDELLCPAVGEELAGPGGPPPAGRPYRLDQNYPNPFMTRTTIGFSTDAGGTVDVRIFDAAGRLVKKLSKIARPGGDIVIWDGTDGDGRSVASGIYFYQIRAGDFVSGKRMILVK